MIALVGHTGFVGSNIYAQGGIHRGYNSKNIQEAYGTEPDLLIYAGMRAEKFLANSDPQADMALVAQAQENIHKIRPKKLVLISTIDVFKDPSGKVEDSPIDTDGLHPYGLHRYRLEQWVRQNYPDALIIRLPGLYGINIKKNLIYDMIHLIPSMLAPAKFQELSAQAPELTGYYAPQPNGFYKCRPLTLQERDHLKALFQQLGFTALCFTDSRGVYQFYPLSRLWDDIQTALSGGLTLWHPATEPVSAAQLHQHLTGRPFTNHIAPVPVGYDLRTKHAALFGGTGGYIMTRPQVLEDIRNFFLQATQPVGHCPK